MVLLNSRIKLGVMENPQSDDFNTAMHVQGITSTNPTNDYELRDKPTETIILTEGASRPTSFQVSYDVRSPLGSIKFLSLRRRKKESKECGFDFPKKRILRTGSL